MIRSSDSILQTKAFVLQYLPNVKLLVEFNRTNSQKVLGHFDPNKI